MNIGNFKGNSEALKAYKLVKDGANAFLTGRAGTGKSTLLRVILQTIKKKFVVCAPTGIAARNVSGATLHSMFRLPLGITFPNSKEIKEIWYREEREELFKKLELLVIDEISMAPSYTIDCIDFLLKKVRGNSQPFGGVQVLFVGDPYQLSPIVRFEEKDILETRYKSEMFFDSKIFDEMDFNVIELKKCYRQLDLDFMKILDSIRDRSIKLSELRTLNNACVVEVEEEEDDEDLRIILTTTNRRATEINMSKLSKIVEPEFTFIGTITNRFDIKNCIADEFLVLKKGAHVIFIKNNPVNGYINGTLGVVEFLSKDKILVRTEENLLVDVTRELWEDFDFELNPVTGEIEKKAVGSLLQFPLKLGFAITIHKSQGLTFKEITIDTASHGAFASGQIYTALSRCVSMEGIKLQNKILYRELIINKKVIEYFKS